MSAVFTGNGLGLFNTSLGQLGSGLGGSAGVGQGRDAQYVNLATGNLVWQGGDEHLVFRGLAIGLTRTYNSLGQVSDAGADGWVTGFERRVALQDGTFNAEGSVMRRTTGDGSYQDFVWLSVNTYQSTGGDGAHDTLTWTGSGWVYVEGSTRRQEGYADHADATAQGRLTYLREGRSDGTAPVTWQVVYDASQRISELRADDGTGAGDALVFGYDTNGRLGTVSTREANTLRLQVSYGYDGQGRLTSVLTDLTPGNTADNTWDAATPANNDGHLFRTEYTYEGTSLRLASVRQSDGTVVGYTYQADGRLKTVTRGDTNTNDADSTGGETTTYAYGTGNTTVTDSLGRSWVYAFDETGQLTSLTAPAADGQSDITTYQYDDAGNVTQAKAVRGAAVLSLVDYAYDTSGNVTWEWDGLGNAINRTWSASNQLLGLTRYTEADPDRTGASLPTGGMTTHYVYDAQDRVRFVVDALGQVSEFAYAGSGNGIGQQSSVRQYLGAAYGGTYDLASLQAWATATQKASSQLSELSYDAWGRLSQRTDYAAVDAAGAGVLDAGTGITRYTYDAQGALRQQITLRGTGRTVAGAAQGGSEQVDYLYDGMGRLLSAVSRQVGQTDGDATTLETTYIYLDSGHRVSVTDDAGKVTVQTRDAAGRLVSVSEQGTVNGSLQTRTAVNYYDAAGQLRASEDAGGGRTYYFYDAKGRLAATVDPTGAVTRTTYDGADRVVATRQYANRVTTSSWLANGKVTATAVTTTDNTALDRVTGRTYDAAGRLLTETDGLASSTSRTITTYTYDAAGRVLQARTTDAAGTAATARTVRYFYDGAGRTIGQLDAAGYLTQTQYDRAGRVLSQTRYATVSPSAYRASGTLAQLQPSPNDDHDQTTRYYYNGRGQQVGVLDAQGYLTEWVYDEAGNARAERRHATALTWSSSDTLATLRSRAGAVREQRMAYNALGQLITQTNAEGTVTRYTYDEAGRLVKTEAAQGASEVREGRLRYNVFGELIGELGGESAVRVLPTMSESELDAVYGQYGVRHGYDALGRRIESIDAAGNRTWYFYDAAGRGTFTVRGVADGSGVANAQGEVTETRYTAFGDMSDEIAYTGRITLAVPGSRASAQAAVSVLSYAAATDTRRQYAYTARGQLASLTDAADAVTQYTYDAFGQLQQQVQAYGTTAAVTLQYQYDARGLQTRVTEGVGTPIERNCTQTYDAFGRAISATDARGAVRSIAYDRLGRQLTVTRTVQGRSESTDTAYDAYDRIVKVTDAEGQVTTYVHDDAARSITVTSPEGTVVTTVHNRHGQTVQVTDAAGVTDYVYDLNGQLTSTRRKAGDGTEVTSEKREYDTARGLLTVVVDGSNRRVEYQYDAAGRVLRRIQDPAGLALATTYSYDGQGRQLSVTDPSGRVTGYQYDRAGRLTQTAQDPSGLNLRTRYAYDAQGRQVSVTEGAGTAAARTTQYTYDVLGRRTGEVVDPGTGKLNITTSYAYDANDNLIRRTDANGQVTRYYYDEADRQVYTVDPLGGITRQWYDRVGQVVAVRAYARATTASTLTDATTLAQLDARVTNGASDQGQYRVYDKDGRVRFELDLGGGLTEYGYDAAGRRVSTRAYDTAYVPGSLETGLRNGTVEPAQIVTAPVDARDRRTYYVLDAAGQTRLTVDALGNVRQLQYDAAGRVVGSVAYASPAALTTTLRNQLQTGTATEAAILAKVTPDAARDRTEYRVYDAAGRLRYTLQAATASTSTVREQRYDAAGRVVAEVAYAVAIVSGTARTVTAVAAAVAGQSASARLTQTAYDAAGRVSSVTDAAGKMESYGYDALGNRTSLTDKLTRVWTYAYDAAGRLVEQASPPVAVATSTVAGTVTTTTRSIKTAFAYDALGNLTSRTEDATTAQARTTQYQYDSRGHQVRTVFPDAWQLNSAGQLVASGQTPAIEVTYDALGQAVVQKDVRGNYSYKVYDNLGQVAYEVDPEGHVTGYSYNAFGEQTRLIRYATKLNFGGISGFVAGTALTLTQMTAAVADLDDDNDRVLSTSYDARGLKAEVVQSAIDYITADGIAAAVKASPTTRFVYNAFGELARTAVLLDPTEDLWAYSWQYYDQSGRATLAVDAEGYVTQTQYNALGETVQVKEYAKALPASAQENLTVSAPPAPPAAGDAVSGYDRVVSYTYDAMGRKASESVLRHYARADGSQGLRPVVTQWTYDAAGQATVTDVDGQQTRTTYDALGRVTAVQEAAQQRLVATAESPLLENTNIGLGAQSLYVEVSAYTVLAYDAFGNAVRTIRYANGRIGDSVVVADADNDQVSVVAYDRQGRAVMNQDAAGNKVYLQYDAADNLVHSWYSLKIGSGADKTGDSYYTYDAAGRQLTSRTERSGEAAPDQLDVVQYNAFGEIVAKGNDASMPAKYEYDKAGNLVRSNAEGGAWRDYGYDLAGHQLRESHTVYVAAGTSAMAVTRYITDRLGRTVAMVLPSHTTDTTKVNYLSQKVDRWGNVIEAVDPRGYQTNYQYNDRDQVVKETRPLVKVVTNDADGTWQRPELTWSYDEMGRLVASTDGNGNTTRYEYDGAGKQTRVIDANGSVTLVAYDALGRERIRQDALGYLTFKQYDQLDRVTAHGDYLPSASGGTRTRKVLESYVLNQNGQRVQVTNALNKLTRYDYDSRGLLVRSQTPMGVAMEYGYDLGGRRSSESYASMLAHPTLVDRDGETVKQFEQSWDYDYFGRLVDRNDLDGNDYDYSYDAASGQLKTETNSLGLSRTTLYTANGLVREIQEPNGTVYRYEYDAAGNRTAEYAKVKDSRGKQYEVRTDITYDSHNRIQRVTQDEVASGKRVFALTYDYDAAGNRTHVVAQTGYGENTLPIDASDVPPERIGTPANRTVRTGIATEFRVRLSDLFRDPEGKPLSVTAKQVAGGSETALPSWLTCRIEPTTGEAVFLAGTGSSAANGQTFTIRLKASDGGSVATAEFTLGVRANTAPANKAGAATSYTVKTGRAWALELAASDYFTDEDVGDSLALTATVSPSAGWLTIDADNPSVLRLSAAAPVAGTYTVTLKATDQQGAIKTRTVTLTVSDNTKPDLVNPIPNQSAVIGREFVLDMDLADVFVDSHGDAMTLTATLPDGSALPGWLDFSYIQDQAAPQLRWSGQVPAEATDGTVVQVKLTATDSDGKPNTTTFNITLKKNRAPTLGAFSTMPDARIGQSYTWEKPISELFLDPEGDQLSLALSHPQGIEKTGWLGVTVDAATGMVRFSGKPNNESLQNQTYTVKLAATDEGGLSVTLTLQIRVRGNNPPVQNPNASLQTSHNAMFGRPFSYTLPDNLFIDEDGDPIGYIVSGYVPEGPSPGFDEPGTPPQFPPLPSWLSYDSATRILSGTVPASMDVDYTSVAIRAGIGPQYNDDSLGLLINYVPFVNTAPVYNAGTLPGRTAKHGDSVSFALPAGAFTEPDGDTLTYSAQVQIGGSWVSLSQIGLSINSSTGKITGTATNLTQASYNIRIRAADPQGAQSAEDKGIFVLSVTNTAPTASAIPDQSLARNQAGSFEVASYFSDVNQNALSYSATGLPAGLSINAGTGVVSGTPTAALDDYTVTVIANDGRGGSISVDFTLTIANSKPTAPTIPNQTATAATSWSYTVPAFTDPNGDALTYTASGLPSWMSFDAATRKLSGTPGPVDSWTITVIATDPSGASASKSFTVTTPNAQPVLVATIGNKNASRNKAFSYTFPAGTFADANGDTLTYAASNLPAGITFDPATRKFSGTPTTLGPKTVTVTASDGRGGIASTTFTIDVVNDPPVYNDTLVDRTPSEGGAISWTLPAGTFTDPNGDGLTYTLYVEQPGYNETYETGEFDEIDIRWVPPTWIGAGSANLSINGSTGTITGTGTPLYVPATLPINQWQYAYRVKIVASDGLASVEGIFDLSINKAPVAPTVGNSTIREDVAWSKTLPAFTDSDALTYTVSGLPAGLSFNASTRVISGTPTTAGTKTVTYTANDGKGGVTSTTFTITVKANAEPTVAAAIPDQTAPRNKAFSYTFPAGTFADADSDALTYTASGMPAGIAFDAATRKFSGTPTTVGAKTVTVTANDGYGGTISTTFKITVTNTAPTVATAIPNQTAPRNKAFSFTFAAGTFSDYNSDTLTYTASGMPAGITFDAATRKFSGTPTTVGAKTVTVTANDGQGGTETTTFTITVTNTAPTVAAAIPDKSTSRNKAFSFTFAAGTFADANGDTLTYTASGMPAGISFDPATRKFSGTPTTVGAKTVTVTANDGQGGTKSTTFTITVVNDPPVYGGNLPNQTPSEGSAISWTLPSGAFTDPNGDGLTYTLYVERPAYNESYETGELGEIDIRTVPAAWVGAGSVNLSINSSSGKITGTATPFYVPANLPINQYQYTYRVKIVASDGTASVEGVFNMSVNKAPVAPTVGNSTLRKGEAWSKTLPTFSDSDTLTYTVSGLPAGLSFNASTRVISGTPTTAGTKTVTYTANDGKGGVASTTFTLTVKANSAPVAPSIGNKSGEKGVAWPATTLPAFTDADSDALTYTATGLPPGLAFTASTRKLSGTPTTAGTYTVTYSANDGHGGVTSTSFSITINAVVNNAPYQNKVIPTVNVNYGGGVHYVLAADLFLDPEGGALTYSATGMPSWLSFAPATKLFSGTPPQTIGTRTYTVGVTATDTGGLSASTTFKISVKGSSTGGGGVIQVAPGDSSDLDVEEQPFVEGGEPEGLDGIQAEPMSGPVPIVQDAWYAYDKLNRVAVSNGQVVGGQVVLKQGDNSYSVSYDAVGNAVAQQRWITEGGSSNFVLKTTGRSYSLRGQVTLSLGDGYTTRYVYDEAGRMTERRSYYGSGTRFTWIDDEGNEIRYPVAGMLASYESNTYDDDGRLVTQVSRSRSQARELRTPVGYPAKPQQDLLVWVGQVHDGTGVGAQDQFGDITVLTNVSTVSYTGTGLGYDAAGRVAGYSYTAGDYTHTYKYTYAGRDSYLEQQVKGTSSNSAYKITTSTMTYDAAGRQTEIREHTEGASLDDRVRTFALDGNGMILSRRDGTLDGSTFEQNQTGDPLRRLNQHYVYANGQQVAGLDEAGKVDALSRLTAFSSSEAGRAQVVVQAGETLRNLAQRVYGSADLWYVIAGANGLEGDADLVAGTSLTVPEVRTSSNDASTFKPYNPGEITGPTSPGLPYIPAPENQCGAIVNVLSTVVSYVVGAIVTVYAGPYAGAAAQGAVQAHSQQVFQAMANGQYDWGRLSHNLAQPFSGNKYDMLDPLGAPVQGGIDYSAVAVSSATSLATYSVGAYADTKGWNNYAKVATQTVARDVTNYQLSKWTGRDVHWSNSSFATNVVSAIANQRIYGASRVNSPTNSSSSTSAQSVGGVFSWKQAAAAAVSAFGENVDRSIVQYGVGKLLGSPDAHWANRDVLADAFGNTLGNAIVGGIQGAQQRRAEREAIEQARARGADERSRALMEGATAGLGGGISVSGDAQLARMYGEDYATALQKMGRGDPYMLYGPAMGRILERADAGEGFDGIVGKRWFGVDRENYSLTADEVQAVAAYVRSTGVADSYADIRGDEIVLLTSSHQTPRQVYGTIAEHLGGLVTKDDLLAAIPADRAGDPNRYSYAVNVTPLEYKVLDRFYTKLANNPAVVRAAEMYRTASNEMMPVDELRSMRMTWKENYRQGYEVTASSVRNQMIRNGDMPARVALNETGEALYSFIGATLAGFVVGEGVAAVAGRVAPMLARGIAGATNALRGVVQLEVRSASVVNDAMISVGNQPAWHNGTKVVTEIAPKGIRYEMVVSEGQAQAIMEGKSAFGWWATPDSVPSQAYARNKLSILEEFKPDVSYVVTVETTSPQRLNRGFAGPLGGYDGTGAQVEFLDGKFIRAIGQPRPLPRD